MKQAMCHCMILVLLQNNVWFSLDSSGMFIYSWKLLIMAGFFVMHPGSYFNQQVI